MTGATTFPTVRTALEALLSAAGDDLEGFQYEITAVLNGEREVQGYRVRIKDLNGFSLAYA